MKRYDDLQYNGLILVQDTDYPCFTEDSVLLVNFLQLKKNLLLLVQKRFPFFDHILLIVVLNYNMIYYLY